MTVTVMIMCGRSYLKEEKLKSRKENDGVMASIVYCAGGE